MDVHTEQERGSSARTRRLEPASRSKGARSITEDEADILFAEKHKDDPRYNLEDVLKELGDGDLLESPASRRGA